MTDPTAPAAPANEVPAAVVPESTERSGEKIKFKQALGREEVAVYLEAIVKGLRKGQIEFRRGGESLVMSPAAQLEMSVKASEKPKGGKLKIELEWACPGTRPEREEATRG